MWFSPWSSPSLGGKHRGRAGSSLGGPGRARAGGEAGRAPLKGVVTLSRTPEAGRQGPPRRSASLLAWGAWGAGCGEYARGERGRVPELAPGVAPRPAEPAVCTSVLREGDLQLSPLPPAAILAPAWSSRSVSFRSEAVEF